MGVHRLVKWRIVRIRFAMDGWIGCSRQRLQDYGYYIIHLLIGMDNRDDTFIL